MSSHPSTSTHAHSETLAHTNSHTRKHILSPVQGPSRNCSKTPLKHLQHKGRSNYRKYIQESNAFNLNELSIPELEHIALERHMYYKLELHKTYEESMRIWRWREARRRERSVDAVSVLMQFATLVLATERTVF
ncbi:hypothetical protein BJ741DRAFT_575115 [Chytriomyces cf. hyalinus JEL632]|nr:hypothetical protein BJ741DRAFT_575115 [Chytriomyces cf. hyalinus JEL632]